MRKVISCLGPLLLVTIALAGCGGGMSSTQTPLGASMSQVSLTIHDNPPMGVTVLSFEIEVTGAALQPSDSSSQPVSMLSEPEDIELEHLQTESALLASRNVPTGAYSGLMVSFANPRMTIQNQTGTTLTLGTKTCSDQQVCEFDPKLNQSSVTVEAPTTPFPITLTMNSPVVLKLDFNLDTSIQQSDLSITPTVSLVQLPPPNSSGGDQGDEDMELIGQVASIDQTMPTISGAAPPKPDGAFTPNSPAASGSGGDSPAAGADRPEGGDAVEGAPNSGAQDAATVVYSVSQIATYLTQIYWQWDASSPHHFGTN